MAKKISKAQISGEYAEKIFSLAFPKEWIVRPLPKDYGVDFEVEIVKKQKVMGDRLWFQLKGTNSLKEIKHGTTGNIYFSFRVDVELLEYSLKCGFPLLLSIVDLKTEEVYWLPIRDHIKHYIDIYKPEWYKFKTVTVHIPATNSFSYQWETGFYGLLWYSKQPELALTFQTTEILRKYLLTSGVANFLKALGKRNNINNIDPIWICDWAPVVMQYLQSILDIPNSLIHINFAMAKSFLDSHQTVIKAGIEACKEIIVKQGRTITKRKLTTVWKGLSFAIDFNRNMLQVPFHENILLPFKYVDPVQP